MSYADERQKINFAVAKYEAELNRAVFEKFFGAGKEQEMLIYETTFSERGNLFGYKRMMWQKFKLDEIIEEMKNPDYFFQHGWFFPEVKANLEQNVITNKNELAYHLHTSLPPQCFENASFVNMLHNTFERFWNNFYIENCKDYDQEQLKFGYKNGLNTMQIKAMQNLKNKIRVLEENKKLCDDEEKVEIQNEQDKAISKLNNLARTPLFQTALKTSQEVYKKMGLMQKENNLTK